MIAEQRRAVADLVEGLTEEQLATPSLCGDWTVRVVAAHLTVPFTFSLPRVVGVLATSGFNFDAANTKMARQRAELPMAEIVECLRANAEHRFTPPGMGLGAPLTDTIVHGQDMRRPLGIVSELASEPVAAALDFVTTGTPKGFMARGRLQGLRLVATDQDWSAGEGDEVRGPGEALLLAATGRPAALDDLEGDGVAVLRARLM